MGQVYGNITKSDYDRLFEYVADIKERTTKENFDNSLQSLLSSKKSTLIAKTLGMVERKYLIQNGKILNSTLKSSTHPSRENQNVDILYKTSNCRCEYMGNGKIDINLRHRRLYYGVQVSIPKYNSEQSMNLPIVGFQNPIDVTGHNYLVVQCIYEYGYYYSINNSYTFNSKEFITVLSRNRLISNADIMRHEILDNTTTPIIVNEMESKILIFDVSKLSGGVYLGIQGIWPEELNNSNGGYGHASTISIPTMFLAK